MEILNASLAMQSQHLALTRERTEERLKVWIGQQRPDRERTPQGQPQPSPPVAQISAAGQAAQSANSQAITEAQYAVANDPITILIKAMLEWLTGSSVKVFNAAQFHADTQASSAPPAARPPTTKTAPSSQPAGYGVEYDYHATREELEQTAFSAQGTIRTADGREIAFNLNLAMSRSYVEQTDIAFRAGDAVRKDPLVINFNGAAAQLSNQRFQFDLNGDGQLMDIPLLGSNSGYLALDLNANGKIDSGAELFGPATGSGFAELAKYDQDHNGWIDEKDAVFERLSIWKPGADETVSLATLKNHDVGALYLGHTETPFALRGPSNQDLGVVRDSGLYLTEAGEAGSLQEIDLTI